MIPMEQLSEAEIITRILKGEKSLYEIIVRRFNPYLYKIGRSYNYNHDDTQDLMQETYIDAYKSLASFEHRANFKTWLVRIMMNNCYRKKEKLSFKNELYKDIDENVRPMFTPSQQQTENRILQRELKNVIEDALSRIPEDYRMTFSLREINGLSVAETATLLGITETNVKVRVNRAKHMLRDEIQKSYAAEELFEFNLIYCNAMVDRVMNIIDTL